jgi:PhnB protein
MTTMPNIHAYLSFNGNCAEAMRFYERTLGGRLDKMLTFGSSPGCEHLPPEAANQIMHAALVFDGGGMLMASDTPPNMPYEGMKGISLALSYPTADEGRRVFAALAEGGRITMPIDKTFWAEAFGMVVDRYGTPWMVNGGMIPF